MRSSRCASPFTAKLRCRKPRFGVVSSAFFAVTYTRISIKNLPYHSPSVMNSKVLHALMYLADRPRRRKWRLPLPPALWLLAWYIPVIQFSSASERTDSCSKCPSIFFGEIGIVLNEKKIRVSVLWLQSQVGHFKILSLFCFWGQNPGSRISRKFTREGAAVSSAPLFGI